MSVRFGKASETGVGVRTKRYQAYMEEMTLEPEPSWALDAACVDDPDLFYLSSVGDRDVIDLNMSEVVDYNRKKIKTAVQICGTCPVRAECLENATPDDLTYTVRGGREPEGLAKNPQGRPIGGSLTASGSKGPGHPCMRGHENDWRHSGGFWRCRACDRLRNAAARKGEKFEKVLGSTKPSDKCKYGHSDWYYPPNRTAGYRRCRRCNNMKKRSQKREEV